jgi:hypothetical protein
MIEGEHTIRGSPCRTYRGTSQLVLFFEIGGACVRLSVDLLAGAAVPNALVSHLEVLKAGPGS